MDTIIDMLQQVTIDKTYYDIKVDYITKLIIQQSEDPYYVDLCHKYILNKTKTITYFGKFYNQEQQFYQTINIRSYLDKMNSYQIVSSAYQLAFIIDFTRNYNYQGQLYCPSIDKYCRKMDEIMCQPYLMSEVDLSLYHDNMITHPQDIFIGDLFFSDIKDMFCNSINQYNMFVSPLQTFYDCDGFIVSESNNNCCNRKFTWTMSVNDFFDFFQQECPIIMCQETDYNYKFLIVLYEEIK